MKLRKLRRDQISNINSFLDDEINSINETLSKKSQSIRGADSVHNRSINSINQNDINLMNKQIDEVAEKLQFPQNSQSAIHQNDESSLNSGNNTLINNIGNHPNTYGTNSLLQSKKVSTGNIQLMDMNDPSQLEKARRSGLTYQTQNQKEGELNHQSQKFFNDINSRLSKIESLKGNQNQQQGQNRLLDENSVQQDYMTRNSVNNTYSMGQIDESEESYQQSNKQQKPKKERVKKFKEKVSHQGSQNTSMKQLPRNQSKKRLKQTIGGIQFNNKINNESNRTQKVSNNKQSSKSKQQNYEKNYENPNFNSLAKPQKSNLRARSKSAKALTNQYHSNSLNQQIHQQNKKQENKPNLNLAQNYSRPVIFQDYSLKSNISPTYNQQISYIQSANKDQINNISHPADNAFTQTYNELTAAQGNQSDSHQVFASYKNSKAAGGNSTHGKQQINFFQSPDKQSMSTIRPQSNVKGKQATKGYQSQQSVKNLKKDVELAEQLLMQKKRNLEVQKAQKDKDKQLSAYGKSVVNWEKKYKDQKKINKKLMAQIQQSTQQNMELLQQVVGLKDKAKKSKGIKLNYKRIYIAFEQSELVRAQQRELIDKLQADLMKFKSN